MSDEMYFVIEDITPARAAELLQGNVHNRNIRQLQIVLLAKDMTDGHFLLTHQPIAVATDGLILDGQHRLYAIIQSGVTVRSPIAYHVDPGVMRVIDRGLKRTLGDTLRLEYDEPQVATLGAALRLLAFYVDRGVVPIRVSDAGKHYTEQECLLVFESHRDIRESVQPARLVGSHLQPSLGTFLHYLFHQKHPEAADEFFSRLNNETLPTTDEHPIRVLRRFLQEAKAEHWGPRRHPHLVYGLVKAWNAFLSGRDRITTRFLRWQGFGTDRELPFPTIE